MPANNGKEVKFRGKKKVYYTRLIELRDELIDEGFDSFHFYTLNKAPLSYAVCRYLGINPSIAEAA